MRKSDLFLSVTLVLAEVLAGLLTVHPWLDQEHRERWALEQKLVRDLGLTDLCLFTEARYARHLSQADYNAAFQDHPVSLEHFPSGSMVLPPEHLNSAEDLGTPAPPTTPKATPATKEVHHSPYTIAGQPLEAEATDAASRANNVK